MANLDFEFLKGKRLLILGGAPQSIKIVLCAKELGIYTIVTDINENAPAKKYADESIAISLFDYDNLYKWCLDNPVDGIINICIDYAQKTLQFLCEKLNLPCFGTSIQVKSLTDKNIFKKLCVENDLDVIPEYTENDIQNDDIEYPIFIKPGESSGSRGGSICKNKNEAINAIKVAKDCSRNNNVIIEKYMGDKPDFQVTYVFIDGIPYLQRTADRIHGHIEDGMENVSALAISPSKYTNLFLKGIDQRLRNMLIKLGLKTAAVFFQGFVDGNHIYLYDPAIRLPGANFENILRKATGIDIVKMFIEYALTGKIINYSPEDLNKAYQLNGKYAAIAFPMSRAGKIKKVLGIKEIESMPSVVSATYRWNEGDTVKDTHDVTQRFGEYDILGNSKEEMIKILEFIQKNLILLDENGKDMIISKPNLSLI